MSDKEKIILERYKNADGYYSITCKAPFETQTTKNAPTENDITIKGWFITQSLIPDRNMIVNSDAFSWDGGLDRFNGRLMAFHDDYHEPIGQVTELEEIPSKGVYGKATIFKENSPLLLRAVKSKVLNCFSIGFDLIKHEYDSENDVVTVIKAKLREVSIVNAGADHNAVFDVVNMKNAKPLITYERGEITLSEKNPKPTEVTLQEVADTTAQLTNKYAELRNLIGEYKDMIANFQNGVVTKSELSVKIEKMTADLDTFRQEVEEIKAANAVKTIKPAYTDYRSLLTDVSWLTDENGNKQGNIAQQAYCLFQMPVDYDSMADGHELKNLRDLYDAVLLADAMGRNRGRDRHSISNLKLFKQLVEVTKKFDPDVALAMAGGNSGYGAEWLPTEMSAEFNEILRAQPTLASYFQLWPMPTGGSAKYPFQNGKAIVYRGSEALVDNAAEARKTSVATGVKTFTPEVFIGALVASQEITEDAVLDMITFIRNELATALNEGLESAIINGDDSTTHFDNTVDTVYQTYNVETAFKGLRKLGISNARDIEDSSSTTGVNALEIVNFTDAKGDLGIAGLRNEQCIYVTGIKGKRLIQNALFKEDALGVLAFMISGELPTLDGSKIYISGMYDEALSSAGIRDSGADTKHTSICAVHVPSFRIGQRRGVTLEFNKTILTQQHQFVATARWDFGKICADSIEPVSEMINCQHTA